MVGTGKGSLSLEASSLASCEVGEGAVGLVGEVGEGTVLRPPPEEGAFLPAGG